MTALAVSLRLFFESRPAACARRGTKQTSSRAVCETVTVSTGEIRLSAPTNWWRQPCTSHNTASLSCGDLPAQGVVPSSSTTKRVRRVPQRGSPHSRRVAENVGPTPLHTKLLVAKQRNREALERGDELVTQAIDSLRLADQKPPVQPRIGNSVGRRKTPFRKVRLHDFERICDPVDAPEQFR